MAFLMAKEGEPTFIWWIGQANTPRLKARYWLQVSLLNSIVYAVSLFCLPGILCTIPALILAIQVSD